MHLLVLLVVDKQKQMSLVSYRAWWTTNRDLSERYHFVEHCWLVGPWLQRKGRQVQEAASQVTQLEERSQV